MGRNKPQHNISLTFAVKRPYSEVPDTLCILYNYGSERKKRRQTPIIIPQKIFNKKKQELKPEYVEVYPDVNEWIATFNKKRNSVRIRLKNGIIDFEQAFKILLNDSDTEICKDHYPEYAKANGVDKNIIEKTLQYLGQFENKQREAKGEYFELKYEHLQTQSHIENIENFISRMNVDNATKKKYQNYLNKLCSVNPNFGKDERQPFKKKYEHKKSPPKKSVASKDIKLAIGEIKDNPYKLEAMLWWLLSFCLRGVNCADILVLDEKKLVSENKGVLKDFIPSSNGEHLNKFYYEGKRVKQLKNKSSKPLKILFNVYPVLLIHKMLKRLVGHLHPNIAYKGKDKVKIYNLDYLNPEDKKKWKNRLGTMSENTEKLFGATMSHSRNTFSTILAQIMSVSYNTAEKEMSTALGHTSTGTQKRYINPDQNKQDLLQIEVIERFDVRKIVQNIIATCQHFTFSVDSEDVKLVEPKHLDTQLLKAELSWWGWQNELEYQQEKLRAYSDVDTIIVDGVPVQKEVFRPTARFKELEEQRNKAWFSTFVMDEEGFKRVGKKISKMLKEEI